MVLVFSLNPFGSSSMRMVEANNFINQAPRNPTSMNFNFFIFNFYEMELTAKTQRTLRKKTEVKKMKSQEKSQLLMFPTSQLLPSSRLCGELLVFNHRQIQGAFVATQIVILTKVLVDLIQSLLPPDGVYNLLRHLFLPKDAITHEFRYTRRSQRVMISINEVEYFFQFHVIMPPGIDKKNRNNDVNEDRGSPLLPKQFQWFFEPFPTQRVMIRPVCVLNIKED